MMEINNGGFGAFYYVMTLMPLIIVLATPSEKQEFKPWVPPKNEKVLSEIERYCQRFGKEPYIHNCIIDRARRNQISAEADR